MNPPFSIFDLIGCADLRSGQERRKIQVRALDAEIVPALHTVPILAEYDDRITFGTPGRLVFWRVFQPGKIILVRATVHVYLGFEILSALRTGLPVAGMLFCVVIAA
jgi:hypothetical protein